jgi:hypothetical protein
MTSRHTHNSTAGEGEASHLHLHRQGQVLTVSAALDAPPCGPTGLASILTCRFFEMSFLACWFTSRCFSSSSAFFGAHVPSVCPGCLAAWQTCHAFGDYEPDRGMARYSSSRLENNSSGRHPVRALRRRRARREGLRSSRPQGPDDNGDRLPSRYDPPCWTAQKRWTAYSLKDNRRASAWSETVFAAV